MNHLTIKEAASELRKSERWLRHWLGRHPQDRDGRPYCAQLGRTKTFVRDDIDRMKLSIADGSRVGFIYVVGFGDYLKIGFSKRLKKRFSAIQTSIPVPLVTHFTFRGSVEDERRYHAQFAQFRLNGEWFRSDPSILTTMGGAAKVMNSFFGDNAP